MTDVAQPETRSRRRWPYVVVPIVVGTLLGLAVLAVFRPHTYAGAVLQADTVAPPMDGLVDTDGERIDLVDLRGDVVLVYFGYTHCPDLCPTTLSTIARARERLDADDADRVHTLMVTVDPDRDSPELVGEYVGFFDDTFRGVWGEVDDVRSVATQYGVFFENDEPGDDGSYLVSHTASLLAIDPGGAIRVVYPVGLEVEELTADLEELLG